MQDKISHDIFLPLSHSYNYNYNPTKIVNYFFFLVEKSIIAKYM